SPDIANGFKDGVDCPQCPASRRRPTPSPRHHTNKSRPLHPSNTTRHSIPSNISLSLRRSSFNGYLDRQSSSLPEARRHSTRYRRRLVQAVTICLRFVAHELPEQPLIAQHHNP